MSPFPFNDKSHYEPTAPGADAFTSTRLSTPCTDSELSDLITLDYNARPTLVPRTSTLIFGITVYALIYLGLAKMWINVQDMEFSIVVVSLVASYIFNWAQNCLLPNQIRVVENGIALGWSNLLFQQIIAPVIPWSSIVRADFEKGSESEESIKGSFLLSIDKLPKPAPFEYPYNKLSAKIWKMKERSFDYQLRILVSGITQKADREFFARSLAQKLPEGAVQLEVLCALDPSYPLPIEHKNAFDVSCTYLDHPEKNRTDKNSFDEEDFSDVTALNEFLPKMARLLPRSIMEEKLRNSLGLTPGEVLDVNISRSRADNKTNTVLSYKPLRMLRPWLDSVERSGSLTFFYISMPLVVIGVALQMFDLSSSIPLVLGAILGLPMLLLAVTLTNPANITMADSGLRLTWRRGLFEFSCPGIPWSDISFVSYTKPAKSWAINTTINFHVQPSSMSAYQRLFYFSFFHPVVSSSNHLRITLIESGLLFGSQSKKFYEGLLRHLPPERLDPLLFDRMCPPSENTFTSLWLSSLTKERVRTEPLDADDVIGAGRYRVVKQIGAGGQGIAYQAICIEGGAEAAEMVVLKEFIIPSHAGQSAQAKALDSVHRECELLQNINHPFVVKIKDNFIEDHRFYLVLEHAQGDSLRTLVNERGPWSSMETMELAVQLLGILSHLHSMSPPVIHRDFTPENIIIAEDGTPKLIDFNVARQSESTATRTVVGKHSYLPPEQFRGKASPQSDIYALGATLFFALTGEDPEPISASRPRDKSLSVSTRLDDIIFHATQLSTDERYKTADEMKEDLLSQVPQGVVS